MTAADRSIYVVSLRPEPGVTDPVRSLKAALKTLLRRHGLRAVAIHKTDWLSEANLPIPSFLKREPGS